MVLSRLSFWLAHWPLLVIRKGCKRIQDISFLTLSSSLLCSSGSYTLQSWWCAPGGYIRAPLWTAVAFCCRFCVGMCACTHILPHLQEPVYAFSCLQEPVHAHVQFLSPRAHVCMHALPHLQDPTYPHTHYFVYKSPCMHVCSFSSPAAWCLLTLWQQIRMIS